MIVSLINVIGCLIMKTIEFHKAITLRKKGYSLTEISNILEVSKSTASIWTRDLKLSETAIDRLKIRVTNGQLKAAENKRHKTNQLLKNFYDNAQNAIRRQKFNKFTSKLFCCVLYWCEGGKYDNTFVQFTNSDPIIVKAFLSLLRESFLLDRNKFRACIHLHPYHIEKNQIAFWSKVTNFDSRLFIKSFRKQNTGKRIRPNYQGCIQIRYYDSNIARDLLMTGKALLDKMGA